MRGFFSNCGKLFECYFFVLLSTFSFPQRYFTHTVRDVYFYYKADIVSRCAKIYPQWFTFETKEREQQTETETETETISKCLVGPIHVPIHFQGETKNKKQKIKDKR